MPQTVPTALPGVVLALFTGDDAEAYLELMRANREHLTRHGNFLEEVDASPEAIRAAFSRHESGEEWAYGVRVHGLLIGRVSLVAVDPPRYGLGFWLDRAATGRGYATAACEALTQEAKRSLAATDIYCGVTHGNDPSSAVLHRLGFAPVTEFNTYTRFHRKL